METLYRSPRLHLARSGYIVFSYFSEVADMPSLEVTEAALKKVAKEHGRVVVITVMSGSTVTSKIPDDVKLRAAALLRSVEDQLVASAMVVTGSGLGVTILRAFMTGFIIFSKLKRPQKCVADLDSALAWIRTLDANAVGDLTADRVDAHCKAARGARSAAHVD